MFRHIITVAVIGILIPGVLHAGPLAGALDSLGVTRSISSSVPVPVGESSLVDADVLRPADGYGLIDVDVATSQSLVGLELVDRQALNLGSQPAEPALGGLTGALDGTLGNTGAAPLGVRAVSGELRPGIGQAPDLPRPQSVGSATSGFEAVNASVGTLDVGSNGAGTVADIDVLNTDTGENGDIGVGIASDGPSGSGDIAGLSVMGGDGAGRGGMLGVGVITGANSARSEGAAIGVISGSGSPGGGDPGAGDPNGPGNPDNPPNPGVPGNPGNPGNPGVSLPDDVPGPGNGLTELLAGNLPDYAELARLCTRDEDGDGICDEDDECPQTPAGVAVLTNGCHPESGKPLVLEGVRFAFDSDRLTRASAEELIRAIYLLRERPEIQVVVAGHTDSIGPDAYNDRLSLRRAEAVRRVITPHIPNPERVVVKGFGESQPVALNADARGRMANRRVEFLLNAGGEEVAAESSLRDGKGS